MHAKTARGPILWLMKLIGASAISIYPAGIYFRPGYEITECRLVHEQVHWHDQAQFRRLGVWLWYVRYIVRSVIWSGWLRRRPHVRWPDEEEAYLRQWQCEAER